MTKTITWLHLSDFHFRVDKSDKGKVEQHNRELVLNKLLEDLKSYTEQNKLTVDFIIITGDIAFSGQKDEYELAVEFLEKIRKKLGLPKNRLFIVPGNHDIDRSKIDPNYRPSLNDRSEINLLLMDKNAKKSYFKKFEGYKEFINKYIGSYLEFDHDNRYFWTKKFKIKETKIGLLGLNSAWNSIGDEDKNCLLIGEVQIMEALKQIGNVDLSIAAFHHPLEWLQEQDKKDIRNELAGKCQFVLHGHMHESGFSCNIVPGSSLIIIPAGSVFEKRSYGNSYNIFSIDRDTNIATQHLRTFSDKLKKWIPDIETFDNAPEGLCQINLSHVNPFIDLKNKPSEKRKNKEVQITPLKKFCGHPKPLEENWVGRKEELNKLNEWYQDQSVNTVGIVGFGGVGKSSLARKWIEEIKPDGIFWWAFYHETSLDTFLLNVLEYLSCGKFKPQEVTSIGARFRLLINYLVSGRFILVLDGLEELQIAGDKGEHFGKMKDKLFTDFLRSFCERDSSSLVLVTTRYPLKDLKPYEGHSYRRLFPEKLSKEDALGLMRIHGVKSDDKKLDEIASSWKYHALSLKLIANYLSDFYDGDIKHILKITFSDLEADEKIKDILEAYDNKLKPEQKEFMKIFSTFRRPIETDAFVQVFRRKINSIDYRALATIGECKFKRKINHLVKLGLISEDKHSKHVTYSTHPLIRSYYYEHLDYKPRVTIHKRVAEYYEAKADRDPKVLDDLIPAIEAFKQSVKAEDYDNADDIYMQMINKGGGGNHFLHNQISAYGLDLSLVLQLFPSENAHKDSFLSSSVRNSWLVCDAGFCLMHMGRLVEAVPLFERSIELAMKKNDFENTSAGYQNLCEIQLKLGNLKEGKVAAEKAIELAKQAGYGNSIRKTIKDTLECYSTVHLAYSLFMLGDCENAENLFNTANNLNKIISKKKWLYSSTGVEYAEYLFHGKGLIDKAKEITHENLTICKNNPADKVRCYRLLAEIDLNLKEYKTAKNYLKEGLQIALDIELQEEIAKIYLGLAFLYLKQNKLPKADTAIKEVRMICTHCGYKIVEIDTHNILTQIFIAAKKPELAYDEAQSAFEMSCLCGYYWGKVDAQKNLTYLKKMV